MELRVNRLLAGGVATLLLLIPATAWSQDTGREKQRRAREPGHTTGAIAQPRQRQSTEPREPSRTAARTKPVTRPRPVVLPERSAPERERRAARGVTVIPRPPQPVRPIYHPVTVIERPITRPTYRPIRWGTTVVRLPQRYTVVRFGNLTYYVSDGVYYAPGARPSEYVVVRPPTGAHVTHLPSDATVVAINRRTFYVYQDVWYDDGLTVVPCPYGGWIHELPDEHEVVQYGNERYYRFGGAVYQPSWRDGRSVHFRVEINF